MILLDSTLLCVNTGSVGFMHKNCLEALMTSAKRTRCDLCGEHWPARREHKTFEEVSLF